MVLEESFQFVAVLAVTLGFSFATLVDSQYRLIFKLGAGLCCKKRVASKITENQARIGINSPLYLH